MPYPSAKKGPAQGHHIRARGWINFQAINQAALNRALELLERWLPNGVREGNEYIAFNPTRVDRHLGSFRINLQTGRWCDFATGDKGTDVISLAAYLARISQVEAARRLATMLGLHHG